LVLGTAVFIAAFTLLPSSGTASLVNVACILCGDRGASDLLLNVVLFLPLGAALANAGVSPLRALLIGLVFASAIEVAQVLLPGRSPTLRDVVTNGAGAWLGALMMIHVGRWLSGGQYATRRLWGATVLVLATVMATGWLLRPAPTSAQYWSQFAPRLGSLGFWDGTVHEAVVVGSAPIEHGRFPSERIVRDLHRAPIRVSVTAGSRPDRISPIFALADDDQHHILMISQQDDDIVVRTYRRTSALRLDTPDIRFLNAFAGVAPGARAVIEVHGTLSARPCLRVNDWFQCSEQRGVGSLWSVLMSRRALEGSAGRMLSALTLFVLVLPMALVMRAVPRAHAAGAAIVLVAGLWMLPPLSGLARPTLLELAAVGAALASGLGVHRMYARSGTPRTTARAARTPRPVPRSAASS